MGVNKWRPNGPGFETSKILNTFFLYVSPQFVTLSEAPTTRWLERTNKQMAFILLKKPIYDTPEGDYRAVVRDAVEKLDCELRIVFQILSLQHKFITYLAGKNYAYGKQTIADELFEWLGLKGLHTLIKADGSIDVAMLKELHADIRLVHIHNDDYDKPFAFVCKIDAPGTLTPDFQSAA
jgi:hypothetical protein